MAPMNGSACWLWLCLPNGHLSRPDGGFGMSQITNFGQWWSEPAQTATLPCASRPGAVFGGLVGVAQGDQHRGTELWLLDVAFGHG
jgi:hypothetical protein